jgi:HD superfamily phosphodiesterase
MNAETIGREAKLEGKPLTDLELLAEIARLKRTVASFGGAMLLAAYQAEAERRGFKEVRYE